MTSVRITPVIASPLCFRNAAIKGNIELLTEFLGGKKGASDLSIYLECINGADGCTPLLCAVKRGDLVTVKLLAEAGAKLLVASGMSALHLLLETSPDLKMLDLLLSLGANPYIPDKTGDTALEYVLLRKASEESFHKIADRFGYCVRSFLRATNVFRAVVQMLVPSKSSWMGSKPMWKERQCAIIPRYNGQGIVPDMQLVIFTNKGADVTLLWVTNATASPEQVPYAQGATPSSCLGLLLPSRQCKQPEKLVAIGSKHTGWSVFIGSPSAAGSPDWRDCPELLQFMAQVKLPGRHVTPSSYLDLLGPLAPPTPPCHPRPHLPASHPHIPLPPSTPPQDGQDLHHSATANFPAPHTEQHAPQATASLPEAASAPVMVSRTVSLPEPAHQLCVSSHCHRLISQCSALGVEYQVATQDTVVLTGPEPALAQAVAQLHATCSQFQAGCVEQVLLLESHEVTAFMHLQTAKEARDIGERHTVRVSLEVDQAAIAGDATFHGTKVQVVQGSLTEQAVTALVNPTNGTLWGSGGVSKHIAAALGTAELEKQCKHVIKALPAGQQSIPIGSSAITTCSKAGSKAGRKRLPCGFIIHAVGPRYQGNKQDQGALLASTVRSVLATAAAKGMASVAMPLIGTGAAGWPKQLAAEVCLAEVSSFLRAGPSSLKVVRFVDLNDEAIAALQAALQVQVQQPPRRVTFLGCPDSCSSAMQEVQQRIEGLMVSIRIRFSSFVIRQERLGMLDTAALASVHCQLTDDCMVIKGCQDQVEKAERIVLKRTADVIDRELGHPPDWAHMTDSNTQLFEVDLSEPTVAGLVTSLREVGATVVKVHRIQNKLLWAAYAGNRFAMKRRWRDEPNLPHINGGGSMLWHGTGRVDPWIIYAAENGFMSNHAKLDGLWGCGTYYSTLPRLAMDYQHSVATADKGMLGNLHSFDTCEGLKQMLAVDVLTGKAKELAQDKDLRIAPEIEGRQGDIAGLRYDSVYGIHPFQKTPIYVTYNSGHAYPKFLITYKR